MIIPWIRGFLNWQKAPLTWTLILLNLFIFLQTSEVKFQPSSQAFSSVEMMVLTGQLYDQYRGNDFGTLRSQSAWVLIGSQGLRDPDFVAVAGRNQFQGDEVAIARWKTKIHEYQSQLEARKSNQFGLHTRNDSPLSWITYQFMHASWLHLLGNMFMLLIFGAALETLLGGLGLAGVYLIGGLAGAAAFLLLSQHSLAPMIGASGSLSAVMAFYAAYEKKRRVSFFYFVSPLPGYHGWIYLPTLLIFPLCFFSDLAGYLSTPAELGSGIAYTAHIGGALFGALCGFLLKNFRRTLWVRWLSQF